MSTSPTDPVSAAPAEQATAPSGGGGAGGGHPSAPTRPTLQQRFEESRVGRRIISGIIVVFLGTQVVWSMPDSAIRRGLMPIVEPVNAIGLNERWSMFAPRISSRVEELEVDVTMADGSTRVWKHLPNSRLEKIFLPDRWDLMAATALRQQDGRIEFGRWVVDRVTGPSDRPVKLVMMFHFRVLPPPGQPSKGATGTKVIYEEVLTGQR
jgi:hypothetical protein